jgi:hypothetical protein
MVRGTKRNFSGCHESRELCLPAFLITERNSEIFGRRVVRGEARVEVAEIPAASMEVRFLAIFR